MPKVVGIRFEKRRKHIISTQETIYLKSVTE